MKIKEKYQILGLDCPSCASMIELDLEDLGVNASCSYREQILKVEYDATKTDKEDIIKKVSGEGYQLIPIP